MRTLQSLGLILVASAGLTACAGSTPADGGGAAPSGNGGSGGTSSGGARSPASSTGTGGPAGSTGSAGGAGGASASGPTGSSSSAGGSTEAGGNGAGGGLASCADLAAANGWAGGQYTCDDGSHHWCAGTGTPTSDCATCCGPSCGVLADHYDTTASCDDGTNHACDGSGTITWDCASGCCGPGIPDAHPHAGAKFGYPLGDLTTSPTGASGWAMYQVLGDYWSDYGGAHLAEDVGKSTGANAQVHAVADGVVLVAAPNSSSYKNVVLISHTLDDASTVCSFYGHLVNLSVSPGQTVHRGDVVANVLDQGTNSHLHYFIAPKALCDHIASLGGGGACGYDGSGGVPGLGHADVAHEPSQYQPSGSNAGCSLAGYTIYAPHAFIDAHHF